MTDRQDMGDAVPARAASPSDLSPDGSSHSGIAIAGTDGWPDGDDVLAELKRRDPQRYAHCAMLSYMPGVGEPVAAEKIADAFQAVEKELACPLRGLAATLGGEAILLRDEARQKTNWRTGEPIPFTRYQKRAARLLDLISQAAEALQDAAIAMEARQGGDEGSVHDSAGRKASPKGGSDDR